VARIDDHLAMATMIRGGLVALALVVCAWFALGAYQAGNTHDANALITGSGSLSAAQARHAQSLLHSAGKLNPDLNVDILRGELALDQHRDATAVGILESVTRREPQNLNAWVQLVFASAKAGDREITATASRHVSALFPKLK
jgi:predicted Zn-dependent protease